MVAAAILVAATWSNWRLDHKLRLPAHLLDLAVFVALMLSSGTTIANPFFIFDVFLVLSAALRWGWKAALLTAAFVAIVFAVGTWAALSSGKLPGDKLSRAIVRGGHVLVLSFMISWFGVTQLSGRPILAPLGSASRSAPSRSISTMSMASSASPTVPTSCS